MASLVTLSAEIIQKIANFSDYRDIGSLRLTCRSLEEKASPGKFDGMFEHLVVPLRVADLKRLERFTASCPRISQKLQECTLVGVVWRDNVEEMDLDMCCLQIVICMSADMVEQTRTATKRKRTNLLASAFRNILHQNPSIRLQTLRLRLEEATMPEGLPQRMPTLKPKAVGRIEGECKAHPLLERPESDQWIPRWVIAEEAFEVAMKALADAPLPVDGTLDFFGDNVWGAVGTHVFHQHIETLKRTSIFGSLQTLRLGVSPPHGVSSYIHSIPSEKVARYPSLQAALDAAAANIVNKRKKGVEYLFTEYGQGRIRDPLTKKVVLESADGLLKDVVQMKKSLGSLEKLEVSWFDLGDAVAVMKVPSLSGGEAQSTSEDTALEMDSPDNGHRLQDCKLGGLIVETDALVGFLRTTQPDKLNLTYVCLQDGKDEDLMEFLAKPETGIHSFTLDDIISDSHICLYWEAGSSVIPERDSEIHDAARIVTRSGDGTKYPVLRAKPLDKIEKWNLKGKIGRCTYGPPDY